MDLFFIECIMTYSVTIHVDGQIAQDVAVGAPSNQLQYSFDMTLSVFKHFLPFLNKMF